MEPAPLPERKGEDKMKETMILLAGYPATGKSYLCKQILEKYPQFQVISQDDMKEALWDEYGFDNMEEKTKLEGKRVLLVEDNELNLEIAQTVLEMQKCLVDSVVNGQEAVDTFRESEEDYYDLILMDIRMPVMDGLEATRLIRALNRPDARTVPIVAMSANAFEEDMKKSLESGMNAHLAKPFQVEALVETLHTIMKEKGAS